MPDRSKVESKREEPSTNLSASNLHELSVAQLIREGHALLITDPDGAILRYNSALKRDLYCPETYLEVSMGLFTLGRYAAAMLAATKANKAANAAKVQMLYATGQNHLAAYYNGLRKGTKSTLLDADVDGIKQMCVNSQLAPAQYTVIVQQAASDRNQYLRTISNEKKMSETEPNVQNTNVNIDALAALKQYSELITESMTALSYDAPHHKELIATLDNIQQEMTSGSTLSSQEKKSLLDQLTDWMDTYGQASIQISQSKSAVNVEKAVEIVGSKEFDSCSIFQLLMTQLSNMVPGYLMNHVKLTDLPNLKVLDAICENYGRAIEVYQFDSYAGPLLNRAAKQYKISHDLISALGKNRKEILELLVRQYNHFRLQVGSALFKCRAESLSGAQYANTPIREMLKPGTNKDNLLMLLNELELRRLMVNYVCVLTGVSQEKFSELDSKESILMRTSGFYDKAANNVISDARNALLKEFKFDLENGANPNLFDSWGQPIHYIGMQFASPNWVLPTSILMLHELFKSGGKDLQYGNGSRSDRGDTWGSNIIPVKYILNNARFELAVLYCANGYDIDEHYNYFYNSLLWSKENNHNCIIQRYLIRDINSANGVLNKKDLREAYQFYKAVEAGVVPEHAKVNQDCLLWLVIMLGDLKALSRLKVFTADVNKPIPVSNFTPLMMAVHCGHGDVVDFLLQKGAKLDLEFTTSDPGAVAWHPNYSPHRNFSLNDTDKPHLFCLAIAQKQWAIVRKLMDAGLKPSEKQKKSIEDGLKTVQPKPANKESKQEEKSPDVYNLMQQSIKDTLDYTNSTISRLKDPAITTLEKAGNPYPLYNFKLSKSLNNTARPYHLAITKQISKEEKPTDIYNGCVGNFNHGKAQIECWDELDNVSLVLHEDGTLAIEQLADGLNYRFQSGGVISTAGNKLHVNKASIEFVCAQLNNNKGSLEAKRVKIRGLISDRQSTTTLNNNDGRIVVKDDFVLKGKHCTNKKGMVEAGKIDITIQGDFANAAGHVIATVGDVKVQSILPTKKGSIKIGVIKSTDGGQILSTRAGCYVEGEKIVTDSDSRLHGTTGTHLDGEFVRQDSALSGNKVKVSIGKKSDLNGVLAEQSSIDIKQRTGTLAINNKMKANESVALNAPDLSIQNQVLAGKRRVFTTEKWRYKTENLCDSSSLDVNLQEGGVINAPIYNVGSVSISVLPGATKPLDIRENIYAGYSESKPEEKRQDINLKINSFTQPIIIGEDKQSKLVQVQAFEGAVEIKASKIDIPFAALGANQNLTMESKTDVTIGRQFSPQSTCEIRSEGHCTIKAETSLKTYHTKLDIKKDFSMKAPDGWDDVANEVFIGGNALFDAPVTTHRILTERKTSPGPLSVAALGLEHIWSVSGTITHDRALSVPPVISIAGNFAATGKTILFAAHLKFKTQTQGEKPDVQHYTQVHRDQGVHRSGDRKCRKAQDGTYLIKFYSDGDGKYYPASVGLWDGVYKNDKNHPLVLTANYRAGGTLTFMFEGKAVVGYTTNTVGYTTNTHVAKLEPFRRVMDIFSKSNSPKSSLEESKEGHSFFRDILTFHPTLPQSPQVVITPEGLFENTQNKIRLIFPYADEIKKVFLATIQSFGNIPPKYHHLTKEDLYEVWVENARQWMQQNPQLMRRDDQAQSRALIPTLDNGLVELIDAATEPMIVHVMVATEGKNGVIEHCLKPKAVFPASYEKLSLSPGTSVVATILNLIGDKDSQLHVTGKVVGTERLQIKVKKVHVETRCFEELVLMTESERSRRGLSKKTKNTQYWMTKRTIQQEASLECGELDMKCDELIHTGSVIRAEKGMLIVNNHVANPVIETGVASYDGKARTFWSSKSLSGQFPTYSVHSPTLDLGNSLDVTGETVNFTALIKTGTGKLTYSKGITLNTQVITQQLPPSLSKKKGAITVRFSSAQRGSPCMFLNNTDLLTQGPYQSVATQFIAPNYVKITAASVLEKVQVLDSHVHARTSGIVGFSHVNSSSHISRQSAIRPYYLVGPHGRVVIIATDGSLSMEGPVFSSPNVYLEAKEDILFPAVYLKQVTQEIHRSIALSFFGSRALEACIEGDFKKGAQELLKEFPVLESMSQLAHSKDAADVTMGVLRTLYHAYTVYKAYKQATDWADFVKSQIHLNPKIRVGKTTTNHSQTEALTAQFDADAVEMKAGRDMQAEGIGVTAKRMKVTARRNIAITSAVTETKFESRTLGVSVGLDTASMTPTVGVDGAYRDVDGVQHQLSHLNVGTLSLKAGHDMTLNAVLTGKEAQLEATTITLETKQDTMDGASGSFNVSTGGSFGFSVGEEESRWASEQAGIRYEKLQIKAKKLNLIGAGLQSPDLQLDVDEINRQNIHDHSSTTSLSIGGAFSKNSENSAVKGFVQAEFRHESRKQINEAFINDAQNNRNATTKKTHFGLFLPLGNPTAIKNEVSGVINSESKMEMIERFENEKQDALAHQEQIKRVQPEPQKRDKQPELGKEKAGKFTLRLPPDISARRALEDYNFPIVSEDAFAATSSEPLSNVYGADLDSHDFNFNHVHILEPLIHSFEHVVPKFATTPQLRLGAHMLARIYEHEFRQAGYAITNLPLDPLRYLTTKNLRYFQKGLHFMEPVLCFHESYTHGRHSGATPFEACITAGIGASGSIYAGIKFNQLVFPLKHTTSIIATFGKTIVKSIPIVSTVSNLLEFAPFYGELRSDGYSPTISALGAGMGTLGSFSQSTAGLFAASVGVPLWPTGSGFALTAAGAGLMLTSNYTGRNMSKTSAQVFQVTSDFVDEYQIVEYAVAPIKGIYDGLKGLVNTIMHPLESFVYPLSRYTYDATILSAVQSYNNNYFGATDAFEQSLISLGHYISTNKMDSHAEADSRMKQRGTDIKEAGKALLNASGAQQIEAGFSLLTSIYLPGAAIKGVKLFKNYQRFGTFQKPPLFHDLIKDIQSLPTIKNLSPAEIGHPNLPTNTLLYVLTAESKLVVAPRYLGSGRGYLHHPQLSQLKAVYAAGEIIVVDGKITQINNLSGHFLPQGPHLEKLISRFLLKNGFGDVGHLYKDILSLELPALAIASKKPLTSLNIISARPSVKDLVAGSLFSAGGVESKSSNPVMSGQQSLKTELSTKVRNGVYGLTRNEKVSFSQQFNNGVDSNGVPVSCGFISLNETRKSVMDELLKPANLNNRAVQHHLIKQILNDYPSEYVDQLQFGIANLPASYQILHHLYGAFSQRESDRNVVIATHKRLLRQLNIIGPQQEVSLNEIIGYYNGYNGHEMESVISELCVAQQKQDNAYQEYRDFISQPDFISDFIKQNIPTKQLGSCMMLAWAEATNHTVRIWEPAVNGSANLVLGWSVDKGDENRAFDVVHTSNKTHYEQLNVESRGVENQPRTFGFFESNNIRSSSSAEYKENTSGYGT